MANGIPQFLMPNEAFEASQPDYMKAIYNLTKQMPKKKKQPDQAKAPAAADPIAAAAEEVAAAATPAVAEREELDPIEQAMQQALAGPSAEEKEMQSQALQRYLQSLEEQKAGMKESKALLDMYKSAPQKEEGTDYNPLYALIDSYAGTQLAEKEKKEGETPEQRQYKIAQLSGMLAKQQGDITKRQADVLKQFSKSGGDPTRTMARLMNMQKIQEGRESKKIENASNFVNKDIMKLQENVSEIETSLGTAEKAIASGDITMLSPVLAILARQVSGERGVLTDRDVGRTIPRTIATDVAGLRAYITNNKDVGYPPSVIQGMRKLIEIAKANRYNKYQDMVGTQEKLWNARAKNEKAWRTIMGVGGVARVGLDTMKSKFAAPKEAPQQAAPMAAPQAAPQPAAAPSWGTPEEQAELDALEKKYGGR